MTKDLVRASEIRSTLNTPGWYHIDAVLEAVVAQYEKDALSEDNEQRIVAKQREARVARTLLNSFRSRIQIAGSPGDHEPIDEGILVAM